jgi:hypothetical protein
LQHVGAATLWFKCGKDMVSITVLFIQWEEQERTVPTTASWRTASNRITQRVS